MSNDVHVRQLLSDYASSSSMLPKTAPLELTIELQEAAWSATLSFGRGGPKATCRVAESDLAEVFSGRSHEILLLADGRLTITGSLDAVESFLDMLRPLGGLVAFDLEMGGHRFKSVRERVALPPEVPEAVSDAQDDQRWIAAMIVARLSRRCQIAELERIVPRSSKFEYAGIDDPDDLVARVFACVAASDGSPPAKWGKTAALSPLDPSSRWRAWAQSVRDSNRPLRAAAATLESIRPARSLPAG